MKIALITPWENAWIPHFRNSAERRGHQFIACKTHAPTDSDAVIHGWATGTPSVKGAKNIVFLRRYELFEGGLTKIDWNRTDALICVNSWFKRFAESILAENGVKVPVHLIYNAVDESKWTFEKRGPGKKVGMACFIHSKKNIPLALQILAALPEGYELHIAGAVQDFCLAEYLSHSATTLGRVIHAYGQIPAGSLDKWWDGMNYCLSASISEGNPNNVIEAMAKGIKPIVHHWPGAEDQFQPWLFTGVQQAVAQIMAEDYDSDAYRAWVRQHFSLTNIERVMDLIETPIQEKAAA